MPINALAPLRDEIQDVPAAILGCAAFTTYGAVHQTAAVQPGESVAVVAIGGAGSSIVQLARAAGASTVIAVDISDEKLLAAKSLGADHGVNSMATDAVSAIRELTDGAGVDVAFEVLGRQQTFEQAVKMLTDGGRMVAVGIAAGVLSVDDMVTRTYSLDHVSDAYAALARGEIRGRAVITTAA